MPKSKARATTATIAKPRGSKAEQPLVWYPKLDVVKYLGAKALTAVEMRRMLGWEAEADYLHRMQKELSLSDVDWEEVKKQHEYGDDYLLKDCEGNKVRCARNAHNRPLDVKDCYKYAQDLLNKNWSDSRNGGKATYKLAPDVAKKLGQDTVELDELTQNGETLVVGRYGNVLSGQHRGIGLILAEQMWDGAKMWGGRQGDADHWHKMWPDGPPSMEAVVVYGVSEDKRTVRTLDNVKTRSFADVLYTESNVFRGLKGSKRYKADSMLEFAIRFLWERLHLKKDPYSPIRTHSESLDFLERHPRLADAVLHIAQEDVAAGQGRRAISQYIPPGTAAGLLYLMAACDDNGDKYRIADPSSERKLSLAYWDKALEYWTMLAKASTKTLEEVRYAISHRYGNEVTGDYARKDLALAVLIKGWARFCLGKKVQEKDVTLNIHKDDSGYAVLQENVLLNGIDLGPLKDNEPKVEDGDGGEGKDQPFMEEDEVGGEQGGEVESDEDSHPNGNGEIIDPTPEDIERQKRSIRKKNLERELLKGRKRNRKAAEDEEPAEEETEDTNEQDNGEVEPQLEQEVEKLAEAEEMVSVYDKLEQDESSENGEEESQVEEHEEPAGQE